MPTVALPALQTQPVAARPPGNGGSSTAGGSAPSEFSKALQQVNGKSAAPAKDEAPEEKEKGPAAEKKSADRSTADSTDSAQATTPDAAPETAPPDQTQATSASGSPPTDGTPAWSLAAVAEPARGAALDTSGSASGAASATASSSPLASPIASSSRPSADAVPTDMPRPALALPDAAQKSEVGPASAAAATGAAPPPVQLDANAAAAPGIDATTALQAARPAAAPGMTGAPAALQTTAQLREPLHSPAFAPALGAQISVMVRDGISEARLHLNPAEMGPIAVHISVEGPSARVDMVAAHAQTRQVLEQSMPALAGALRENGLTLTGGGVFDQSRDPRQTGTEQSADGRTGRQSHGDAGGDGGPLAGMAGVRDPLRGSDRPRGMLDLYA